jgi:hypothetical protein
MRPFTAALWASALPLLLGASVAWSQVVDARWFSATNCRNNQPTLLWDTLPANPPIAACITTAQLQQGVADFRADRALAMQTTFRLPVDWVPPLEATVVSLTPGTNGAFVWQIATACVQAGDLNTPAFNPPAQSAPEPTPAVPNTVTMVTLTDIDTTDCVGGALMHLKVLRDALFPPDTLFFTQRLIGVEVLLHRLP